MGRNTGDGADFDQCDTRAAERYQLYLLIYEPRMPDSHSLPVSLSVSTGLCHAAVGRRGRAY